MISLFLKLRLLNYILNSFKDIVVKLFFFTVYFYIFSIILMSLSHGLQYAIEYSSPKNAFSQLCLYFKWCYDNRDNLDYGISIRILVAFLIPHFLYKSLLCINWRVILRRGTIKIVKFFKRENDNQKINESTDEKNINKRKSNYENDLRLVNTIKLLLVKDIEQAIDKRLYAIFLAKRNKN